MKKLNDSLDDNWFINLYPNFLNNFNLIYRYPDQNFNKAQIKSAIVIKNFSNSLLLLGNNFINNNGLKGVLIIDRNNTGNSTVIDYNNFINNSAILESNALNLRV